MIKESDDGRGEEDTRRPYEPPRVVESAQFETLALGCDKVPGVTGTFECDVVNPQDS